MTMLGLDLHARRYKLLSFLALQVLPPSENHVPESHTNDRCLLENNL